MGSVEEADAWWMSEPPARRVQYRNWLDRNLHTAHHPSTPGQQELFSPAAPVAPKPPHTAKPRRAKRPTRRRTTKRTER